MLSLEQLRDAIRAALEAKLGPAWNEGVDHWCIKATFADGVIIDQAGKLSRLAIAVDLFDEVQLGEPEPVEMVYRKLEAALVEGYGGGRILGPLTAPGFEKLTEAEKTAQAGSLWAAVAIQAGTSKNRNHYPESVLRTAAPLYEGAKVFLNHELREDVMRDPRDLAGRFREAKFALIEGEHGPVGAVIGTLKITDKKQRERMLEAEAAGEIDLYGLSHTAQTEAEYQKLADGPALVVNRIRAVESLDIVSFPSAGGRMLRLVAGMSSPVPVTEEGLMKFADKLKKLQEGAADLYKLLSAQPTEAEVDALLKVMEAKAATPPPAAVVTPPAAVVAPALSDADRSLLAEVRSGQRASMVEAALRGVNLPEAMAEELRKELIAREGLTTETAKAAVEAKVAVATRVLEGSRGIGFGAGITIEGGQDGAEKALNRLDDIMMSDASSEALKVYESIAGRKATRPDSYSIRGAYVDITGDRRPFGQSTSREGLVNMERYRPILAKRTIEGRRVMEASALLLTTWTEVFGDSVARRMISEYRSDVGMDNWRKIASVVPLNDFRTQHRIRVGGFGDLSTVTIDADYTVLAAPGDEEVTYAAAKRGNFFDLAWETLVNDDLGQVRSIPVRMGKSAARTLFKFVTSTLCAANPTVDYDSVALFVAAHSNIITSALSPSQISVARQKMAAQTDMSTSEKLNLFPSWLMVPVELEEIGWRIVNVPVANVAGQNATEPSYQRSLGLNQLIVNPYLTDTNNWFVGADKGSCPFIEIGFLFGQEEPTIVVGDQQAVDPYFIADRIRYKIRHVYGGDVVDHRGVVGGIVA
jgi:hypothetical protein